MFSAENEGLMIAEIEFPDAQQPFKKPPWLGDEVTGALLQFKPSTASFQELVKDNQTAPPLG